MRSSGWRAVAASSDLEPGHIYQTRLQGQGLAIWRASSGEVNVWEDRCPHRGVRLSIGSALGDVLQCRYHAWRFGSGDGGCRFIPAHPDMIPSANARARVYPAVEAGGLVWAALDEAGAPPVVAAGLVLRALPVNRGADAAQAALADFEADVTLSFFVQPVEADRCVIRGVAQTAPDDLKRLEALDQGLEALRRRLEAA